MSEKRAKRFRREAVALLGSGLPKRLVRALRRVSRRGAALTFQSAGEEIHRANFLSRVRAMGPAQAGALLSGTRADGLETRQMEAILRANGKLP